MNVSRSEILSTAFAITTEYYVLNFKLLWKNVESPKNSSWNRDNYTEKMFFFLFCKKNIKFQQCQSSSEKVSKLLIFSIQTLRWHTHQTHTLMRSNTQPSSTPKMLSTNYRKCYLAFPEKPFSWKKLKKKTLHAKV